MIPVRRWCARRGVSPGSGAVAPDQAERAGPGSAGHRVRDRRRGRRWSSGNHETPGQSL